MTWPELRHDNPENRVAGNVDDRIKHAIYESTVSFLLEREPWRSGMFVHECHAGRGVYEVDGESYAGSASRVTRLLDEHDGSHRYEAYEWDPRTRRHLRNVVGHDRVLGDTGDGRFDGETYIADHIHAWDVRHLVLMDPFGIWERAKLAERRARYQRIFSTLSTQPSRPVWLLYLTWKNTPPALTRARRLEVTWRARVPCAVWIAPPETLCEPLRRRLADEIAERLVLDGGESGLHELPRVHVR